MAHVQPGTPLLARFAACAAPPRAGAPPSLFRSLRFMFRRAARLKCGLKAKWRRNPKTTAHHQGSHQEKLENASHSSTAPDQMPAIFPSRNVARDRPAPMGPSGLAQPGCTMSQATGNKADSQAQEAGRRVRGLRAPSSAPRKKASHDSAEALLTQAGGATPPISRAGKYPAGRIGRAGELPGPAQGPLSAPETRAPVTGVHSGPGPDTMVADIRLPQKLGRFQSWHGNRYSRRVAIVLSARTGAVITQRLIHTARCAPHAARADSERQSLESRKRCVDPAHSHPVSIATLLEYLFHASLETTSSGEGVYQHPCVGPGPDGAGHGRSVSRCCHGLCWPR